MNVYLIAHDDTENTDLVMSIRTDLPERELVQAIGEACREFASSDTAEARNALSAASGHFNWGDMALWLPREYQTRHGFEILDAATAAIRVNRNEVLAEPVGAGGGTACRDGGIT